MRPRLRRLSLLVFTFALSASAACQRTFISLDTPAPGNPTASLPTPVPNSGDRAAVITRVEGRAEARADASGEWQRAVEGRPLAEGAQVRTGADDQVFITFTEGSKVQIGPNTTVTFNIFYPDLNSPLASLAMSAGRVWVLLVTGALDVETPLEIASAREAWMSVDYQPQTQALAVTCLRGTCSFGTLFIPENQKFVHGSPAPAPMTLADYAEWGVNVPEATAIAFLATESSVQGSATLPLVATGTPAPTQTLAPDQPTSTPAPSTPTPVVARPSPTPIPFTPIPPARILGRHTVRGGETIFCIGRGYGVLPAAIAQANSLPQPFTVFPGQVLSIPEVRWATIQPGPVCPPQFESPFPGLPVGTDTPPPSATLSSPPLTLVVNPHCIRNCDGPSGDYDLVVDSQVTGGVEPYEIEPGVSFLLTFPRCTHPSGTITARSADGQVVSVPWSYTDAACVPSPTP